MSEHSDEEGLSEEVRELLRHHIATLDELGVVLALHATKPDSRSTLTLAREVGIPLVEADRTLAALRRAGLVSHDMASGAPTWRLAPRSARVAALVERLVADYPDRQVQIIRLLSRRAVGRLRDSAGRLFGDLTADRKKRDA